MKYVIKELDERYFAGIEYPRELKVGEYVDPHMYLEKFIQNEMNQILMKESPNHIIGLSCYLFEIEEDLLSYYILTETIDLIDQDPHITKKKLPKGKYVCFELTMEEAFLNRKKIFEFCKSEGIVLHNRFDYIEFLQGENYNMKGAKVTLCLMVEE